MPGRLLPFADRAPPLPPERVPVTPGVAIFHRIRYLPAAGTAYLDEDTPYRRRLYRQMLDEPSIKAAVLDKVFNVASLDVTIAAPDEGDARGKVLGDWMRYAYQHMTLLLFAERVLLPGLIDGAAVAEKKWVVVGRGKWAGKRLIVPKEKEGVGIETDRYGNVTGVRYQDVTGGQQVDPPGRFLIFRHLPLFGAITGTSDFRAAARAFQLIKDSWVFRMKRLQKGGQPFLLGKYVVGTPGMPGDLLDALDHASGETVGAVPQDTDIEAVNLANLPEADYQSAIEDLRREAYLAICGAVLQALEGSTPAGRGDTKEHRATANVRTWYLAAKACEILNEQAGPDLVDVNFLGRPEVPSLVLGGVSDADQRDAVNNAATLAKVGFPHSVRSLSRRFGFEVAANDADRLHPPAPAGGPGGRPFRGSERGGPAGDGCGLDGCPDRPDCPLREFCGGPGSGRPGPCPQGRTLGGGTSALRGRSVEEAAVAAKEASKGAVTRVVEAAKARLSAAGKALYDRMPAPVRKVADVALAVEHRAEAFYHEGQALAREVARETGASEAHVERVGRVLAYGDTVSRWGLNWQVAHGVLHPVGGPVAAFVGAKASYYVPTASLSYVGYKMAREAALGRDPMRLLRAARERVAAAKVLGGAAHAAASTAAGRAGALHH